MSELSAPAELVIEVTADDIANGTLGDECRCPIALAVARQLGIEAPEGYLAIMDSQIKIGSDPGDWHWGDLYRLPSVAEGFIDDFDSGREVQPFTFTARLIGGPS
jgi:hypothetical protein